MSEINNRLTIAPKLFSAKLITEHCYDESVAPNNLQIIAGGVFLANAVKATIKSNPQLIKKLISVLRTFETFNSLANKLSHDLYKNDL